METMPKKTMRNQQQAFNLLPPRKEVLHGITKKQRIKKGYKDICFKKNF